MIRTILNIVMLLCLMVVMDYRLIENAIHEMLGLFTLLLLLMHNKLNCQWYTTIGKGTVNLLRILKTATNLLLSATMLLVAVTGVMISQTVFASLSLNDNILAHELHILSAYLSFILMAIHLGFHWNTLWGKLCNWLRINRTSYRYIILSRIASVLILGYGIYASFERDIGSKLLMQHLVNNWGTTSSLISFVADYAAIIGCYVFITYYVTYLLQKFR